MFRKRDRSAKCRPGQDLGTPKVNLAAPLPHPRNARHVPASKTRINACGVPDPPFGDPAEFRYRSGRKAPGLGHSFGSGSIALRQGSTE